MKLLLPVFYILPLIWVGLPASSTPVASNSRTADEDNIRETLFRKVFDLVTGAPDKKAASNDFGSHFKVYFLAISRDRDPTDAFMKRFAGHQPPVKKVSEHYVDMTAGVSAVYDVKDQVTHEVGIVFTVGNIKWLSRNRVQARAGFHSGRRSAMDSLYTLVRKNKGWMVTKISDTMNS